MASFSSSLLILVTEPLKPNKALWCEAGRYVSIYLFTLPELDADLCLIPGQILRSQSHKGTHVKALHLQMRQEVPS